MSDLFQNLNDKQIEGVRTLNGPLLVIAGAGSGKTKLLTHRVAYLIEQGVNPYNVLAVTFTNKAANEMKERIKGLLSTFNCQLSTVNCQLPIVSTFHSLCVQILKQEIHQLGYEKNFLIYDTADTLALIKRILKEKQLEEKHCNPKTVLTYISQAKNQLLDPKQYRKIARTDFQEQVAELYPLYQNQLRQAGALDFDDLIMQTVELFRQFPLVLDKYQERFRYLSVDEYQDTNFAQYTLVKMLAEKYRNLCVIGDDWQSIYAWRGADMQNILDFEKDYPEAKVIKLEQNYRSTQTIIEAANQVIKNNSHRTEKTLWTENLLGEKIELVTALDERDEGEQIINRIKSLVKTVPPQIDSTISYPSTPLRASQLPATSYQDFVLLYRTHAQTRVLEETFLRHGIPYKIVGGVRFYERKEIKDVLAYLRLVYNSNDDVSFLRIINVPPRRLGSKSLEKVQNLTLQKKCSLYEALRIIQELDPENAFKDFYQMLKDLKKRRHEFTASALIKYLIKVSKYKDFLLDGTEEGEERLENVRELISVASKYDGLEPGISLAIFLEEVALVSDLDQLDESQTAVTLMTLHNAKGLEFPYVFIVGLEEGIFPHIRSQFNPEELEEERRLMYVGLTRARFKVFLLHTQNRLLYGDSQTNPLSRFVREVPSQYLDVSNSILDNQQISHSPFLKERSVSHPAKCQLSNVNCFSSGDRVSHQSWGVGQVVACQGDVLTVIFENKKIGLRKLAANIAPLEKVKSNERVLRE
ncbi:ATP-dependent DNA helicase PcrA [Candidatus Peregrinibacteria bacterium CG08_land_8_20_14_0_20_41_10]|nr:MAG: ATP-dependent DNA helicase PcrA [Candidatus Peregrinibacteria bacterium CG08_land_8_20_14_0_20_41_10]